MYSKLLVNMLCNKYIIIFVFFFNFYSFSFSLQIDEKKTFESDTIKHFITVPEFSKKVKFYATKFDIKNIDTTIAIELVRI
jgi:hypothetical protein